MSLPKIDYPVYNIKIPSLKKDFKFRPFLVKEEKLLLMAKENESPTEILSAIKQIINNCSVDNNFDVNKTALFDLEYVFLKLRAVSIDNTIKVSYKDTEDGKVYEFDVNLDEIEVIFPDKIDNKIKITDKTGIIMKWPSATLYDDEAFMSLEKDQLFELIIRCIDSIYVEDEVYEAKDYKKKEVEEFLENLNIKVFEQIQNFLLNVPKLYKKLEYKNELGNDREIVLSSLSDFFTWR
jgi:hypothetical protein